MTGDAVTFSAPTISSKALMILGLSSFGLSPILFLPLMRCTKKLCLNPGFVAPALQLESTIQSNVSFVPFVSLVSVKAAPGVVGARKDSHGSILPF